MSSGISPENDSGSGIGRRKQRISDKETERRMLLTATEMVTASGLTVSLEHIRVEDVIRGAGVSRSAVYRRWPYKDMFFADLLRQLAAAAGSGTLPQDAAATDVIKRVAAEHADRVDTPEQRHAILLEILRESGLANFRFFHESTAWRTYVALHATFLSLASGELRDDVQNALTESERQVTAQIAAAYEYAAAILGYRLRPELGATFETMAELLSATMRGLVLMAPTVPDMATRRMLAVPPGAPEPAEWSQPALGIALTVLGFLEPDPDVEWTDHRLATTREALRSPSLPYPRAGK